MAGRMTSRGRYKAIIGLVAIAAVLAACSSNGSNSTGSTSSPDNGTQLTMWVRSSSTIDQPLVDAYNSSHKNHINLTMVPEDTFQQKVGAAAGSNSLPDILSTDVAYAANYTHEKLFVDVTDRVKALPFASSLIPSHLQAASLNGRMYAVPHAVDSSVMVYNKDLFTKAGLDPSKPPTNFDEFYADAKAIRDKVGGDTYGTMFAGNCAGCLGYRMMPMLAAAGQPPLKNDGKTANFDNAAMVQVLTLYRKFVAEGIAPSSVKTEDGSTQSALFLAGKIGVMPTGNYIYADLAKTKIDWGYAPIMAPDGSGTSTFVGGDVIGVSRNSQHVDQAWDFIKWSLGDDPQVNIVAKSGAMPVRTDLADNQYSASDPRVVATIKGLANGYTASSLATGQIFNVNTGPWLIGFRAAVFNGDDPQATATKMQADAQKLVDDAYAG
jgi:multiple sugar transport system substrate-binding protein